MNGIRGYCRCCHSPESLKMLHGSELYAFKLICNPQVCKWIFAFNFNVIEDNSHYIKVSGNDDTSILACFQCRGFLKEVNIFIIECIGGSEVHLKNLDVESREIKPVLRDGFDDNSSQVGNKTEVNIEYNEKNQLKEVSTAADSLLVECTYQSSNQYEFKVDTHDRASDKPFSCDQCNFSTTIKRYLTKHKRRHLNASENPFKCNKCSHNSTSKSLLKLHTLLKHNVERPLSCDHCDFRGRFKSELIRHMMKHCNSQDKSFKCTECSYQSWTVYEMKRHTVRKHTNLKPFSCDQCDYSTSTKTYLTEHKRKHLNGSDERLICNKCSFKTIAKSNLIRHIRRRHSNEKPLFCDHCDHRSRFKSELVRHMASHFGDILKPLKCTECPHRTFTHFALKRHISRKHTDKKFSCDQCNYSAPKRRYLTEHKRKHSNGCYHRLICNRCSFTTTAESILRENKMSDHSDVKPFCCDHYDHRSTHFGGVYKPFKCTECSHGSFTPISPKPTDEKPFSCDQCNFRAATNAYLKVHKRLHLNDSDNPYKCSECSYKAMSMSILRNHTLVRHSDEKPFCCDQCDFRANSKKRVNTHKKIHLNN